MALSLVTASALAGSARAGDAVADVTGPAYDGRFNFVRIRWGQDGGSPASAACAGRREPPWAHDMCRRGAAAESYFATILDETTFVDAHIDGKVLRFDDPELGRYPLAYIVEVGLWEPSRSEIEGLRSWLLKGGFLIVDDFRSAEELRWFESQLGRALPGVRLLPVEAGHRVWDTFFHVKDPLALAPSTYAQHVPMYLGVFEDNDPGGRLMAIVNFNQDLGEYWEWSPDGFIPIPLTNEAYKFGVNYVMYALTH